MMCIEYIVIVRSSTWIYIYSDLTDLASLTLVTFTPSCFKCLLIFTVTHRSVKPKLKPTKTIQNPQIQINTDLNTNTSS